MSKIDEIREVIESIIWQMVNVKETSVEIVKAISPYLSHGITEEEARTWFNAMSYSPNQLEFMIEGKNLGLITFSQSNQEHGITEDTIFINHIQSHLKLGEKVVCKICGKTADEIITSSREPITKPEHTIHALAEDQKDIDPRIPPMVNDQFWELVGEAKPGEVTPLIRKSVAPPEPERLVKAREMYCQVSNSQRVSTHQQEEASDNYIRELEARVKELEGK